MAEPGLRGQARRSFLGLAAGGFAALTLTACELVPTPNPEPAREPPPEERVPEETAAPEPIAEAGPHRVAVLVPLTGTNAGVGQSIANAANLALLDTGGQRIRITVYDTARSGAAAAANLALSEGNGLILGPLLADDVRAVAPLARRADVPVISFSNDSSVAGDGVYLMGFAPRQSIERVVGYAAGQGLQRFGALAPANVYGRRASEAMIDAAASSRVRLLATQTFDSAPGSLRTAVSRLTAEGAYDAVLIADAPRSAAAARPLLRPGTRILGTELWATETAIGRTPALRGAWYAAVSDNMFNQMRTKYRARYGANPYRLASLGYDAVLLAVRVAGEWRPNRPFPERELRDPGGFVGLDGAFRFRDGGVAERALEVREVTAAGTRVVSPAARGFD